MLNNTAITQMKEALQTAISSNYLAGANLMVIKDGREIFYHEDGYADRENKLPVKRDSIFRLYSMSKPVTAAAVMILLERGLLDLYEPVSKYLHGFKNQLAEENGRIVPVTRDVTIRDLLSMTSGLVYGGDNTAGQETEELFRDIDQRLLGESPMGTFEAMNKLGKCTLAYQPGTSWQYGTSADVLGAVVEVVSGMRFGEFLRREIFEPLEMEDTGFWVTPDKRDRLVKTYEDNGNGELVPYTGNHLGIVNKMDRDPAFESGGAGLVSTIDDYSRFSKMLLNEGSLDGVQILRPKTVRYMAAGRLNEVQQKSFEQWQTLGGHSYGNLMRVMTDLGEFGGLGSLGEYGWDGWLGAYFCNCPKDNMAFLFMMQKTHAGTTALTRRLRNIVMSSCCN